jgi:hypothetical protein
VASTPVPAPVSVKEALALIDAIKSALVLLQQPVVIEASDQEGKCPVDFENWIVLGLALPLDARGRRDLTPLCGFMASRIEALAGLMGGTGRCLQSAAGGAGG